MSQYVAMLADLDHCKKNVEHIRPNLYGLTSRLEPCITRTLRCVILCTYMLSERDMPVELVKLFGA